MGQELKILKKSRSLDSDHQAIFNSEKHLQKLAFNIQKDIDNDSDDIAKNKQTKQEFIIEITPSRTADFQWENQSQTLKKIREYVDPGYVETVKILFEEQTRFHLHTKDPRLAYWSSKYFQGVDKDTIVYLRYYVLVHQVKNISLELNQLILYGYSVTILNDKDIPADQLTTIKQAAKNLRKKQIKKYGLEEAKEAKV